MISLLRQFMTFWYLSDRQSKKAQPSLLIGHVLGVISGIAVMSMKFELLIYG